VPWTHLYKDEEIEHGGQRIRIPELAKEKQEDFVLKPSYLYEGRGVKVGSLTNRKEWEDLTVSALNNDYVIQERIDIPAMPVAVWNDQMRMEERWIHLGEFVFGGRFCGLYCRAANKLVIDRRSKELLVPCLIMNP
jgi:glutathionylspermidine synthase